MKTRVTPEGKFITDPDPAPGSMDWPACAQYYCLGIVLCALALVLALAYDRIQGHTFGTESQQWLKGQELEKERACLAWLRFGSAVCAFAGMTSTVWGLTRRHGTNTRP